MDSDLSASHTPDMPAECEVQVPGRSCGVLAVGRCRICRRAFCGSHEANLRDTTLPSLDDIDA